MKPYLGMLVGLLGFAACASQPYWFKPGATSSEVRAQIAKCKLYVEDRNIPRGAEYDRKFELCMIAAEYQLRK